MDRMYRYFEIADNDKWYKVLERAKGGATDALSLIGYHGEVSDNPICKENSLIHRERRKELTSEINSKILHTDGHRMR